MARYKMRQKMISFGDDFTIEDENGNPAYEVDGKVMRIRETFELKDRQGNVVAMIRGKLISIRSKMEILRNDDVVATVTKALFAPFRDKFKVDVAGGGDMDIDGSILDHEYTITRGDKTVAMVSKRWFTFTDTYGIEVASGEDDALVLAIAVALDEMAHDKDDEK
ncbi:MAG TPA: LURP-one-related family protein [Thermoanaerobaculia bacterium]